MKSYPSLEEYNADAIAAREAYRADRAVEVGICATCQSRRRETDRRECTTCRRARYGGGK